MEDGYMRHFHEYNCKLKDNNYLINKQMVISIGLYRDYVNTMTRLKDFELETNIVTAKLDILRKELLSNKEILEIIDLLNILRNPSTNKLKTTIHNSSCILKNLMEFIRTLERLNESKFDFSEELQSLKKYIRNVSNYIKINKIKNKNRDRKKALNG